MSNIIIRKYKSSDEKEIVNICHNTGYMGEDLTNNDIFNDVKLFGYLFCFYYIRYETHNCFVAVDKNNNKVVGYILGTLNTKKQESLFKKKMILKIALRSISYTIWKHPESIKALLFFIKSLDLKDEPKDLYKNYPAHLHINILPTYQHLGIGTMLISNFEKHVRSNNVVGIHLRTSNKNVKAIPFYGRNGFDVIYEKEAEVWKDVKNYKNMIFGKKLV